jgi:hypothetical protein
MATPPFRIHPTNATNVNAGTHLRSPSKAEVFEHATSEGESLYEAAVEENAPDREVGPGPAREAGTNRGEDHLQVPDHPPAIPWPQPALGVTRSPMKLK